MQLNKPHSPATLLDVYGTEDAAVDAIKIAFDAVEITEKAAA